MRFAAQGYAGGKPGALGGFRTSHGTRPDIKLSQRFPAGTTFTLDLPGGGGFFDPLERDEQAVARDVAEGLVSPAAARREYGIEATRAGRIKGSTDRSRRRRRRGGSVLH
jgi:N-methylhydantoinase B